MSKNRGNTSDSSSIEQIYQKKTPLEHILLRPDTYVGSTEMQENKLWVWDSSRHKMVHRQIHYVPGLYKILDEILVNAADNFQRDSSMNEISVELDPASGMISVSNNGRGIPVVIHQEYNMYVPELIFGHLLTSSNYDDTKKKVTGGRNGYGAKLANVFSTKFTVETADLERKKKFKMTWKNNMTEHSSPELKNLKSGEKDYTKVTFYPDFEKFGMQGLDQDILDLMTKRVYDLAGCSDKKVKVFLNNQEVKVKNFRDYVKLYVHDETVPLMFDIPHPRWEVAVTISEGVFQQVSFVNSICTSKGGTHVTYISDQLINAISGSIQKKHKKLEVKNNQIKQHLWVFVNCLVENPCFDSQTKETMTLKPSSFGSKFELKEKFVKEVVNCGVIDHVVAFAKAKTEAQLGKKVRTKKAEKIFVKKLEDANDAGTKNGKNCTLILTEGDSAKALAMAGLEVIGRDEYGVFPLKGKLLNVREASHKQLMANEEIQNIMKITGLQPKREYKDLTELRYGSIMIMADQDLDGSHIKGLVINLIHFFWPGLLKIKGFLKEFITPIVKATKGTQVTSFFTLPEYEQWLKQSDRRTWKIKYYKGLGTSTSKEAQEYFSKLETHRISFIWTDESVDAIELAFSKKRADDRKKWLSELDPDTHVSHASSSLSYSDFVNKELILFSNYDNIRSIPSAIDGLKPGQRKIIFACFKRKLKQEIKVAQLAGYVAEHSAYHHGEQSLASTIVGLAQNFVGSNNINLLLPIGQFGTRNMGGKDVASSRYIFTNLAEVTRKLFMPEDEFLYEYQIEEGQKIEPHYYVPILPLVLINGAEGIGTGWSTNVPPYNPMELIEAYKKKIQGIDFEADKLTPWFKGYSGSITKGKHPNYDIKGVFERLGLEWVKITELPVKKWTSDFKKMLEELCLSDPPFITDIKEYHTENRVHFEVKIPKLDKLSNSEIMKKLKLETNLAMGNLVLFNKDRKIQRYNNIVEVLEEHFSVREEFYHKRKSFLMAKLTRETQMLSNKVRFILAVVDGELIINKKKKAELVNELKKKGFYTKTDLDNIFKEPKLSSSEESVEESDESGMAVPSKEYDYLLSMPLWTLTYEKVEQLKKEQHEKTQELEVLTNTHIYEMWHKDLDELKTCIQEAWDYEENERLNRPQPKKAKAKPARKKPQPKKENKKGMTQSKLPLPIKTASDDEHFIKVPKIPEKVQEVLDSALKSDSSDFKNPFEETNKRKAKDTVSKPLKKGKLKQVVEKDSDSEFEL